MDMKPCMALDGIPAAFAARAFPAAGVVPAALLAGGLPLDGQTVPAPDADGWVSLFNGRNFA